MILNCFYNKFEQIKEKRLIFQETLANEKGLIERFIDGLPVIGDVKKGVGSIISILKSGASAAEILAGAGAKLAVSFSNAIDFAVVTLGTGVVSLQNGTMKLTEYLKDKYVGKPESLPEYEYMSGKYFAHLHPDVCTFPAENKKFSELPDQVKGLMTYDYWIANVDALILQIKAFYQPVINEFEKVDKEIQRRERRERDTRDEREKLKKRIENTDSLLNSGHISDKGEMARLDIEKRVDQRSLTQLEDQCSKDVMWSMPQTQRTEFPAGSGNYITRFIPGQKTAKINLDRLYLSLAAYSVEFEPLFEKYLDEKVKLVYWKETIIEEPANKTVLSENKHFITGYKGALDDVVKQVRGKGDTDFATEKKDPDPMYYLITDAFETRKKVVNLNFSKEYIDWNMFRKIPNRFKAFGCYLYQGRMFKKDPTGTNVFDFMINPDGSVSTQYPNNKIKTLPPGADPNNINAWIEAPQMPQKLLDYGCKFENGKIVKEITYPSGQKIKFTYEVQPDGSIIATPDIPSVVRQKLPPNVDPGIVGAWKPI